MKAKLKKETSVTCLSTAISRWAAAGKAAKTTASAICGFEKRPKALGNLGNAGFLDVCRPFKAYRTMITCKKDCYSIEIIIYIDIKSSYIIMTQESCVVLCIPNHTEV